MNVVQAVVLFVIVLLYFLCHTPRFILNIHEFITLDTLRNAIESGCNSVSLWALGGASISHFLMTLNSRYGKHRSMQKPISGLYPWGFRETKSIVLAVSNIIGKDSL